jgi:hypothetical protein
VLEEIFETDNFCGFHLRGIKRGVQMQESSQQALGRNLAMLHQADSGIVPATSDVNVPGMNVIIK